MASPQDARGSMLTTLPEPGCVCFSGPLEEEAMRTEGSSFMTVQKGVRRTPTGYKDTYLFFADFSDSPGWVGRHGSQLHACAAKLLHPFLRKQRCLRLQETYDGARGVSRPLWPLTEDPRRAYCRCLRPPS